VAIAIGDLLKHDVYELAEHYNLEHELIPKEIITATHRLNCDQSKDQDSLPRIQNLMPALLISLKR